MKRLWRESNSDSNRLLKFQSNSNSNSLVKSHR